MKKSIFVHIAVFVGGLLFALGLGIAGMTNPAKVIGFLDIFGKWDPSLTVVLGTGVALTFIAYRLILKRPHPLLTPKFLVPTRRDIDARLISGAVLFGVGWGISGLCPGPAITSSVTGSSGVFFFLLMMVIGQLLPTAWEAFSQPSQNTPTPAEKTQSAPPKPQTNP